MMFSSTHVANWAGSVRRKPHRSKQMKIYPVILAGSEFATPIEQMVERSILDFPVRGATTACEMWSEIISESVSVSQRISMLFGSSGILQNLKAQAGDPRFDRYIDPRSNRGTAGALADHWKSLSAETRDVEYMIVIDRSACPPHSLERFLVALSGDADVLVGVSEFDRLAGVLAIRPSILDFVPEVGYFDLKEQALQAALQAGLKVATEIVVPRAIRLNSVKGWIDAVKFHLSRSAEQNGRVNLRGACVDPDADVGNAAIIDSIVMNNVQIHDEAVVARSVICEGVVIPAGTRVVDSVVTRRSRHYRGGFISEVGLE